MTRRKKPTKHLVTVGTHVPTATKMGLMALAESQNKSVYEYLQELIQGAVDEFEFEVDALKEKSTPEDDSGTDLL